MNGGDGGSMTTLRRERRSVVAGRQIVPAWVFETAL
jgi:hypothetical protein